jgi:hypothetical protein
MMCWLESIGVFVLMIIGGGAVIACPCALFLFLRTRIPQWLRTTTVIVLLVGWAGLILFSFFMAISGIHDTLICPAHPFLR